MNAVSHERITLRGLLQQHKVYAADGWGKGEIEVPGEEFTVIITGKLLNVRVGDSVEVTGNYVETKWGRQFKVDSCTPFVPHSVDGIVLWMCSRFPDVGRTRAHAMIARFMAEDLWAVIENEPHRLTEIKGITAERAEAISAAYKSYAHEREHMTKLRGWGLTDKQVARCLEAWGDLSIVVERIRTDPYELANVVDGFGFKRADRVALAMGIREDAPARIRAGVLYVLDAGAQEGHCFLWGGKLREMASRMLGVEAKLVVTEIFAVCEMQRVVRRGARVYSVRYDKAEAACAEMLGRMIGKAA
jgi:exodeoxyribonuclease V alpha subunit